MITRAKGAGLTPATFTVGGLQRLAAQTPLRLFFGTLAHTARVHSKRLFIHGAAPLGR